MRNVDAVLFTECENRNEKQFEIILVNGNNCIDHKSIFQDFTLFFSCKFSFDSEDEEHFYSIKNSFLAKSFFE